MLDELGAVVAQGVGGEGLEGVGELDLRLGEGVAFRAEEGVEPGFVRLQGGQLGAEAAR